MQLTSDIRNPSLKIFLNSIGLLVMFAAYAGLWSYLWGLSHAFWFLPAGLRFVTLMYTRRRYWPVFILAEWVAILNLGAEFIDYSGLVEFGLASFAPSIIYAAVLGFWLNKRNWTRPDFTNQGELVFATLAIIVCGVATALALFLFSPADSPVLIFEKFSVRGISSYALGDVAGVLFFLSALESVKGLLAMDKPARRVFFRNVVLLIFPTTAVIAVLTPTFEWAFLALMFLPIVFLALKHGWPGATFSLMVLNITAGVSFLLSGNTLVLFDAQVFLVSVGFTGLFLGASVTRQTELTEDIRKISQRMITSQEIEKKRISRDLHDHIGQVLTALTLRIAIIKRRGPDELKSEFEQLDKLAARVFHDVHEIVGQLSPRELSHFGLKRSLEGPTFHKMLEASNITYTTSIDDSISEIPEHLQLAIFRISQEALSNTAKHSLASVCRLKLALSRSLKQSEVYLEIHDDGIGFDPAAIKKGHGLQNIRDRVHALLGNCTCTSGEDGTLFKIMLPV